MATKEYDSFLNLLNLRRSIRKFKPDPIPDEAITEILEAARAKGITAGKDPTGLAAATLYIASIQESERRTQREIAAVARVTEVTVRNRYKEMVRVLNLQVEI